MNIEEARQIGKEERMPVRGHELRVLRQRLQPDIFIPDTIVTLYKRVKRNVLFERVKVIPRSNFLSR